MDAMNSTGVGEESVPHSAASALDKVIVNIY